MNESGFANTSVRILAKTKLSNDINVLLIIAMVIAISSFSTMFRSSSSRLSAVEAMHDTLQGDRALSHVICLGAIEHVAWRITGIILTETLTDSAKSTRFRMTVHSKIILTGNNRSKLMIL